MNKLLIFVIMFVPLSVRAQIITSIAGGGTGGDGTPAVSAAIYDPVNMAFDKHGNLYFATNLGHKIRKIDTAGIISTIAGTGNGGFTGDNGPATAAELKQPFDVAFDTAGNLYIADQANHRIRKVTMATGIITTVAGNGIAAFGGDNGPATAASLNSPFSICFDAENNLYIADGQNCRIRKVNAAGTITTIAGTGVFGNDGDNGPAINAKIGPACIRFDKAGNLYIAEANLLRVRKIDTAGIITTIAGDSASYAYNGDGIPATQAGMYPSFIALDPLDALYISDQGSNYRIRKIGSDGIIHTVAGNGVLAYNGDNGPATAASIYNPSGLVFDSCGNLYLGQINNPRIRKVTFNPNCWPENVTEANSESEISIYPNPVKEQLTITGSSIKDIVIVNAIGQVLMEQSNYSNKAVIDVSALSTGIYFVKIKDKNGAAIVRKFLKE